MSHRETTSGPSEWGGLYVLLGTAIAILLAALSLYLTGCTAEQRREGAQVAEASAAVAARVIPFPWGELVGAVLTAVAGALGGHEVGKRRGHARGHREALDTLGRAGALDRRAAPAKKGKASDATGGGSG